MIEQQTKRCGHCGRVLQGGRPNRKFCNANHRAAYHRGQQCEQAPATEADVRAVRKAVRQGQLSVEYADTIASDKRTRNELRVLPGLVTDLIDTVAWVGKLKARGDHHDAAEMMGIAHNMRRHIASLGRLVLETLEDAGDDLTDGFSPEAESGIDELTNVLGLVRASDGDDDDDDDDGQDAL